ncbi:MAG TPA: bifunctional 4-hydroxy-2-oxoglutarate aldolase/2-dehydro-3-deoxy-phosphogluconate aldolase, partial [Candidatus Caenarcaniphilales bacterium]
AVIRATHSPLGHQMAKAVAAGGMHWIEITWNSEGAAELIAQLRYELPACTIGTGSLLTTSQVQQAIAAGAQFLFTPHCDLALIHTALDSQVPIIPGALSPTEIVTAWQAGATSIKVFPVQAMGGASYIQSLQGPLGHIPLIPTGGVTLENAASFLAAGAIGVGLSSNLFPKRALDSQNWSLITELAQTLMQSLQPMVNPGAHR